MRTITGIESITNETVTAESGSFVTACSGSFVTACSGSVVTAESGSVVIAFSGSVVNAKCGSVVTVFYDSAVNADYGSVVTANSGSVVNAFSGSVVTANYYSVVNAFSGSVVNAKSGSNVTAYPGSIIYDLIRRSHFCIVLKIQEDKTMKLIQTVGETEVEIEQDTELSVEGTEYIYHGIYAGHPFYPDGTLAMYSPRTKSMITYAAEALDGDFKVQ